MFQGRSSDSTESGSSCRHNSVEVSAALSAELAVAASNRARVGSFRSRLKKQQPINITSESDPASASTCPSRQQSMTMTVDYQQSHPIVAVTVHEFENDQPRIISDL